MKQLIRKLLDALNFYLWKANTETGELLLGFTGLVWGIWLLHPAETFQLPSYQGFIEVAPEWAWGLAFLLLGLFTLYATLINSYKCRRLSTLANVIGWTFVMTAFFVHVPQSTAVPVYFLIALSSIWLHIRVRFRGR